MCAGQDGFIIQEQRVIVGGKCEIEDEGAQTVRCDLVTLVPFLQISD